MRLSNPSPLPFKVSGIAHFSCVPFGRKKALCPVRLLRKWLELSGITEGPLFRSISKKGRVSARSLSADTVGRKVKAAARAAGLNEKEFSAHSLRAGLITAAAKDGKQWHRIMDQSRHDSMQTVKGYIRDATLFEDNAADGLY
jgi:integrase